MCRVLEKENREKGNNGMKEPLGNTKDAYAIDIVRKHWPDIAKIVTHQCVVQFNTVNGCKVSPCCPLLIHFSCTMHCFALFCRFSSLLDPYKLQFLAQDNTKEDM